MRVAILGAGGMGGYFGALLARAGEEVTFIARGQTLRAFNDRGITFKSSWLGDFSGPVAATDEPSSVGAVDLVMFCVKSYDVQAAAQLVQALVGPGTLVVTVQNGVEAADQLSQVIDPSHVLGGSAWMTSHVESPGVILHVRPGRLVLGELGGGASPRADGLRAVFERAGVSTEVHTSIRRVLWEKFMTMCPVAGLTGMTRLPIGVVFGSPELRTVARGLMEEVEAVARVQHIDLPPRIVEDAFSAMIGMAEAAPWAYPSLYQDLISKRRIEIDALNGAVVRQGRAGGVPTPLNGVVYAALEPYRNGPPDLPTPPQHPEAS